MHTKSDHKWVKVQAQDNQGNKYHAYLCEYCDYLVVAFPQLQEQSQHVPQHRLILLKAKDLGPKEVEMLIKKYDVECDDGDDDGTAKQVQSSAMTSFREFVESQKKGS